MDAVDWSGLAVLAGVVLGSVGYLSRHIHREVDGLRAEMRREFDVLRGDVVPRLDRLEEQYIRHLELHAR